MLILAAMLPMSAVFAQDAPKAAISAFQKTFPAATKAKWEKEKDDRSQPVFRQADFIYTILQYIYRMGFFLCIRKFN